MSDLYNNYIETRTCAADCPLIYVRGSVSWVKAPGSPAVEGVAGLANCNSYLIQFFSEMRTLLRAFAHIYIYHTLASC